MSTIKKVAVIGTGVIGAGWIIRCLAHDKLVCAYDIDLKLKNRRINPGDKTIKCMGYLCDIASESQIKKYYNVESEDNTPDNFIM